VRGKTNAAFVEARAIWPRWAPRPAAPRNATQNDKGSGSRTRIKWDVQEYDVNKIFPMESDHPLFRYFTEAERNRIESIGEVKRIADGAFLIRAGEIDSTLFAVEEGHLDIVVMEEGKMVVVATVGPGDVLGEVSFIDDSPRAVSVKAGEETTVRSWDKRTLSEALAFDPQLLAKFAVAMCELLVERLRDMSRRV
jgi:CRP/FNR family cyclic AMP-dependent transcriptional regulator